MGLEGIHQRWIQSRHHHNARNKPLFVHPLRVDKNRSFYWRDRPFALKEETQLSYSVQVFRYLSPIGNKAQKSFLTIQRAETIRVVNDVFHLERINIHGGEAERKNDRSWELLLKDPPTHRLEISAHIPYKHRGVMKEKRRMIFAASLSLKGFIEYQPRVAYLIGKMIAFEIINYQTTYFLNHSPHSDRWYFELILAVARSQLKETNNAPH